MTATGTADWLRNLQADPRVEVVMPSGSAFAGRAEIVADDAEYVRALWALDRAMLGAVRPGTFVGRDPVESAITAVKAWFPFARITPTGIALGATDPGGARHLLFDGLLAVWLVRRAFRGRRGRL